MMQRHGQKKRIFAKKQFYEDKEILGEKKAKVMKKYSSNYET
jgi:hypothetical protein